MKLTQKDKQFLDNLEPLFSSNDISIEMKNEGVKRMVLRGNYGEKIAANFNMTRQGVRWRFYRLFNEIYISAYEAIYLIESRFGIDLRQMAIEIAKERVELRKKSQNNGQIENCRRGST